MANISRYSILHPSVIVVLMVAILCGGVYAFNALGKREDSTFTIKSAIVVCPYGGATPEEVESLVVEPLEREIRTLSAVHKITSEAHFGYARLMVELNPATSPKRIPQLWDELRRKVANAKSVLPEGVGDIEVVDDFGDVYGLYYALVSDGGFTWRDMHHYAMSVERELYAIDGVDKVMLYGEQTPEVNVWISPSTLSAFDLRPEDIGGAIARQNRVSPLGSREAGEVTIELVEGSTYASLSELENQLLMASDGKQYRLGDIATIEQGYHTPPSLRMRVDGNDAVAIAVSTNPDMDIVKVGDDVEEVITHLEDTLPAGLSIVTLYPENKIAREANNMFVINLLESLAIVILLVMLVMGWRQGVIVGVSLVLSIAATIVVMLLMHEGVNRTSLAGFIIAMGMLVDNAIVVVDNTRSLSLTGLPLRVAAVEGATRPRYALLAATIIAILSFLPLQLSPSSVAEIIRPLFVVVAVSLLVSWFFALVQVPLMSVAMLRIVPTTLNAQPRSAWFGSVVGVLLRHRWATLSTVVGLFILSLWVMGKMPQNFFPQLSKSHFRADVIMADGYDIEAMDARLKDMSSWLLSQPEVVRVSTTAGGTPPRYYLASSSYASRPNYGNILIEVEDATMTPIVEERFDMWARDNFADVWLRSSLFRLSPVPEATIEFGFVGDNIDTLSRLTRDAMLVMKRRTDTRNVRNSWGNRIAVWKPHYSQIKAQRLGVERSAVARSLEMSTSGYRVATFRDEEYAMPILLRSQPSADNSLLSLTTLPVFSARGRSFSLAQATSEFTFKFEPPMIRRIDFERVMKAQCDVERGVNTIALFNSLKEELEQEIAMPEGYRMEVYGEQESRDESNDALASQLPVTLLLIFAVLVLLFGNVRAPLVVLVTVPLIFIGVVAALAVTGKMFDFFSLLGLLGLVGMNIKNSVILLSRIDELRGEGIAPREAIISATQDRFIPVVAASATTVLGISPLLFDSMFGSMAATIMGGLIIATFLVLMVLPVVYSLFYRVRL